MVTITQPLSAYVDNDNPSTHTLRWTNQYTGQYAFEVLYKQKSTSSWLTTGKIESDQSDYDLRNLHNLTGIDLDEIQYRLVVYYQTTEGIETRDFSDAAYIYSLIFNSGSTESVKVYDGTTTSEYPLFSEIKNDAIDHIRVSTDDGVKKLPVVDKSSPLAGTAKIVMPGGTVKHLAGNAPNFTYDTSTLPTYGTVKTQGDVEVYAKESVSIEAYSDYYAYRYDGRHYNTLYEYRYSSYYGNKSYTRYDNNYGVYYTSSQYYYYYNLTGYYNYTYNYLNYTYKYIHAYTGYGRYNPSYTYTYRYISGYSRYNYSYYTYYTEYHRSYNYSTRRVVYTISHPGRVTNLTGYKINYAYGTGYAIAVNDAYYTYTSNVWDWINSYAYGTGSRSYTYYTRSTSVTYNTYYYRYVTYRLYYYRTDTKYTVTYYRMTPYNYYTVYHHLYYRLNYYYYKSGYSHQEYQYTYKVS